MFNDKKNKIYLLDIDHGNFNSKSINSGKIRNQSEEQFVTWINSLDRKSYFFVNVRLEKSKLKFYDFLKKFFKKVNVKLRTKTNIANYTIRTEFDTLISFKFMHNFTNIFYKENSLEKMENDWKVLNKVFKNDKWYFKNSFGNVLTGEWKDNVDFKKHYEDKITTEEYDNFQKWNYGAFLYLDENKEGKILKNVVGYDFNGKYMNIFKNEKLPWGKPIYHCDLETCEHDLILLKIQITATIKNGRHPFITLRKTKDYQSTQWHKILNNKIIHITASTWERMIEFYDIEEFEILENICFKSTQGLGKEWIDYYLNIKDNTKLEWLKKMIKINLNMLNGKMAMKYTYENPVFNGLEHKIDTTQINVSVPYIPFYIFVLSYGRNDIIDIANHDSNYEHYICSVTDSVYFINDPRINLLNEIDDKKNGALKHQINSYESFFWKMNNTVHCDKKGNVIDVKHSGYPNIEIENKSFNEIIELFTKEKSG